MASRRIDLKDAELAAMDQPSNFLEAVYATASIQLDVGAQKFLSRWKGWCRLAAASREKYSIEIRTIPRRVEGAAK